MPHKPITFDRMRLDFYDFRGDTPLERMLYGALFGTHTYCAKCTGVFVKKLSAESK